MCSLTEQVSIERRLVLDAKGMSFPAEPPESSAPASSAAKNDGIAAKNDGNDSIVSASTKAGDTSLMSVVSVGKGGAAEGASGAGGNLVGGKVKKHELHVKASELTKDAETVMAFQGVQLRDDIYSVDREDIVRVRDAAGTQVMYAEAVRREEMLREEMLLVGTYYLQKFKDKGVADRAAVLEDLFQSEAAFYESLKLVLDVYVECYEHCTDEQSQRQLAQTMITLIARRPVLDLSMLYLSDSYASEVVAVQMEASLVREVLSAQTVEERQYRNTIAVRHAELPDEERIGFPGAVFQPVTNDDLRGGQPIYYPTPGSIGVAVLDLYHSLESVAGVGDTLAAVLKEMVFIHRLQPGAMLTVCVCVERDRCKQQKRPVCMAKEAC